MNVLAVIPVKPLGLGKSRLSGVLSDGERMEFNRRSFLSTLGTVMKALGAGRTIVVSEDAEVLAAARERGAGAVAEFSGGGLNGALGAAAREASARGADAVLVLPVDLPLLGEADIEALIAAAPRAPAGVLAPDRRGRGTNAILLAPPGLVPFAFGPGSFAAHRGLLAAAGAGPVVVRRDSLAFDIDTAEDYARLMAGGGGALRPTGNHRAI